MPAWQTGISYEVSARAWDSASVFGSVVTNTFTYDTTPPSVEATTPEDKASGVDRGQTVIVTFSEPMDTATVTVTIEPTTNIINSLWNDNDQELYIVHTSFATLTLYLATVEATSSDLAHNQMVSDYTWTFETTSTDTTPPYVVETDPDNGEENVSIYASIEVTFSEPMNTASAEAAFSILPSVAGLFSWRLGNTKMIFDPTAPLNYLKTYQVTVSTVAEDEEGNNMVADEVWTFTTERIPGVQSFTVTPEVNGKKLYLSWTNPNVYDFQGTMIRWSNTGYPATPTSGNLLTSEAGLPGSAGNYAHSNLINGQIYYYTAFTYDSQPTYSLGVNAQGIPQDTNPPDNVSNVVITSEVEGGALNISFDTPSSAYENNLDYNGVLIRYSDIDPPSNPYDDYFVASVTGTFDSTGSTKHSTAEGQPLVNGTTYYYTLFSYDGAGNYSQGVTGEGIPKDLIPPDPVTNFTAIGGNQLVTLFWTNPAEDYAGTRIVRRTDRYPTSETDGNIVFDETGTGTVDAGLTNGQPYYYGAFVFDVSSNYSTGKFALATPEADTTPPTISNVKFDGRVYLRQDVISAFPSITALIEDDVGVSEIEISANQKPMYVGRAIGNFVDELYHGDASYDSLTGAFEYKLLTNILTSPPVDYIVTIEAWDTSYNPTRESFEVKVYSGGVAVIGRTLAYPTPFKPLSGEKLYMSYTLSVDANITIYVYDTSGKIILTKRAYAGSPGGRAGYNHIEWNGITDFGDVVGNGMYVYKIMSGNKALATGHIVVFE